MATAKPKEKNSILDKADISTKFIPPVVDTQFMKGLFIVLFIITFPVWAQETCPMPDTNLTEIEKCLSDAVEIMARDSEEDSPEAAEAAANLFLSQYETRVDFEVTTAEHLLQRIEKFTSSETVTSKVKSRLWLRVSGLHGKIAQKLQLGGAQHGKEAYNSLKKSLAFDKRNEEAAISYAKAIEGIAEQNLFMRIIIENSLGVKVSTAAQSAAKALEDAGLKSHPYYLKMVSFNKK